MSMTNSLAAAPSGDTLPRRLAPRAACLGFCALLAVAAVIGVVMTEAHETTQAVAQAGTDWAHLLRAMAVLKTAMAAGAAAAVVWRLTSPVSTAWLAAYSLAGTAMMAGPGLIWGLAHIGLGALLLHAGLAATLLLLWRDPQVGTRLATRVAARRAATVNSAARAG